nr:NADH dehydrogenase subunit 3 [Polydesmus sp. GZCS-2019]
MGLVYLLFILVVVGLAVVGWVVSFGEMYDEGSMSAFECGFISFDGARLTFSLQFFLVAVVFLVFDVEIALILPLPVVLISSSGALLAMIFSVFVIVVLGGLYYEWGSGVLDWGY